MYLLENTLRPYAWGSERAIADLLGREPSGGPEAELWIGAHPDSPSYVIHPDGARDSLHELIGRDPASLLGEPVAERFGNRLPFLLKVLAMAPPCPCRCTRAWSRRPRASTPRRPPECPGTQRTATTGTGTTSRR